jgi:hypothetical protein
MHEPAQHDLTTRDGTTGRAQRWLWLGALTTFAVAAWKVGVWVNHWYVAERFLSKRADLLSSGNRALVAGLCWLGVMTAFVAGAIIARRRPATVRERRGRRRGL